MPGYDTIPTTATLQLEKFELHVSEQDLKDFKDLVRLSKLAPETYENTRSDGRYGVTHEWISQGKKYWETQYDWREREKYINSFPNFKVDVDDQDGVFSIHFAALFSKKKDAVPILFLHGWPGSHLEFLKILDLYRQRYLEDELPYHIIVPSLPGYSLSSGPPLDKDWNKNDLGRVLNSLMVGLGFGSGYVAQGGDVGSFVCRVLATLYDECKAIHLNFSPILLAPAGVVESDVNDAERAGLKRMDEFHTTGNAYVREHGTRPATIGLVLSASPLSLLAWIGEKFIEWTDTTPPLEEILDSVTLYWFTQSFPRCLYPYREFKRSSGLAHGEPKYYCKKPLGYSWFPKELAPAPRAWVEKTGNLVFHRQHDEGGHFAATEKPELLAKDVDDFVQKIWPLR